ncbi:MAG: aspartate carbamoyltransferase regulatory subunit [Atribacterota bacterium]|nr:aspartate carbamoyltransferase regulatory subunit [Atribacterota bacterium]
MINVSKLKKGIVIDHIKAGNGYKIFQQLELNKLNDTVVLLKNIPSNKMGIKDLIKIENDIYLDLTELGLIDSGVTINIIENGQRKEKIKLKLPQKVKGILKCKNPRCISTSEEVGDIEFTLVNPDTKEYQCEYCHERITL